MTQSRRMSLIEAVTNVALGYALAVATQSLVFYGTACTRSLGEKLTIDAVFIGIFARQDCKLRQSRIGGDAADRT